MGKGDELRSALGRYFCKYCRVWFADNKSGHAVHERGEKHREAVAKFLDDTEKRGVANEKKQHSLAKQMSEIEKAALLQYHADLRAAGLPVPADVPPVPVAAEEAPKPKAEKAAEKPKTTWATTVTKAEKEAAEAAQAAIDSATGFGHWRTAEPATDAGASAPAATAAAPAARPDDGDDDEDDGEGGNADLVRRFRFKEKQAALPAEDDADGADAGENAFKKRKLDGVKQRSFRKK